MSERKTNRHKYFLQRCEEETLRIIGYQIQEVGTYCPIRAVSGLKIDCVTIGESPRLIRYCNACISKWINDEAR